MESTEGPHAAWATFSNRSGFLLVRTPAVIAALIREMGSADPKERPSALQLVKALEATDLARGASHGHGCCSVS